MISSSPLRKSTELQKLKMLWLRMGRRNKTHLHLSWWIRAPVCRTLLICWTPSTTRIQSNLAIRRKANLLQGQMKISWKCSSNGSWSRNSPVKLRSLWQRVCPRAITWGSLAKTSIKISGTRRKISSILTVQPKIHSIQVKVRSLRRRKGLISPLMSWKRILKRSWMRTT